MAELFVDGKLHITLEHLKKYGVPSVDWNRATSVTTQPFDGAVGVSAATMHNVTVEFGTPGTDGASTLKLVAKAYNLQRVEGSKLNRRIRYLGGITGETNARLEFIFFSRIASLLESVDDVRVPKSYLAVMDDKGQPDEAGYIERGEGTQAFSCVVMEDMRSSKFHVPASRAQASPEELTLAMRYLAKLHSACWGPLPQLSDLPIPCWQPSWHGIGPLDQMMCHDCSIVDTVAAAERYVSVIPALSLPETAAALRSIQERWDQIRLAVRALFNAKRTLLHGDFQHFNMLFHGEKACAVDWQSFGLGSPAVDFFSFVSVSAEPFTDANHARKFVSDLMTKYYDALSPAAAEAYPRTQMEADFKAMAENSVGLALCHWHDMTLAEEKAWFEQLDEAPKCYWLLGFLHAALQRAIFMALSTL